ncbi:natterin-4-like [Anopheles nili]|uniref:natterin-4-like n=1 Tax=Anopheles nili TaxID=185578 RepID=UPI00237B0FC0|nr:natterin-4-like [Anopheles nili]
MVRWQYRKITDWFPSDAVLAGHDIDKSPIYIGKANHESDQIPGKIIPSRGIASVCYYGKEHNKDSFEVLCGSNVAWISAEFGRVPPNAVPGGYTSSGEILYIGRTKYLGSITPGKIHRSHRCLYIPFNGREEKFDRYEVLIEI